MSRKNSKQGIVSGNVVKILLLFMIFVVILVGSLPSAEAATVTLKFEKQALDLDTGQIIDCLESCANANADMYVAFNARRIPHSVAFLSSGAVMIAVSSAFPYDWMTAQEAANLEFTANPPDMAFKANVTVVIKTADGAVYKLGNTIESDEQVTFEYELMYIE